MKAIGRFGLSIAAAAALLAGLLLPAAAAEQTIQDFLAVQQQGVCTGTAHPPCPANQLFLPPVPNYGGWSGQQSSRKVCTFKDGDLCRFALVDYAGIAARFIKVHGGPDLGTTFDGTVTKRPVGGGKVEVSVTLRTHDALAFVSQLSSYDVFTGPKSTFLTSPLLFGARVLDVLHGQKPALADAVLVLHYIDKAGAPFPNLIPLLQGTGPKLTFFSFRAVATGKLRAAFFQGAHKDGGQGRLVVLQDATHNKIALKPL